MGQGDTPQPAKMFMGCSLISWASGIALALMVISAGFTLYKVLKAAEQVGGANDVTDVSLTGATMSSPPAYNLGVKEGARKACCNRDLNIADQERLDCGKVACDENHVDIKEPCHRKTHKYRDADTVSKDIWSEKENDDLKNGKDVKLGKDLLSQVEHLSLERNQEEDVDKEIASGANISKKRLDLSTTEFRTRLTSIPSLESGLSKEPKSLTDHEQLIEVNTKAVELFVGKDPDSNFDLNQTEVGSKGM